MALSLGALALGALALVAPGVLTVAAAPAVPAQAPQPPARSRLSIDTITPSRLVPGRPVRVTGTVFNNTEDTWGDPQIGMIAANSPFTSPSQVAAATTADPYQDFFGDQILEPGTFDDIKDVAPGESRSFSFTVPYEDLDLVGSNGVYWVGAELRVTDGQGLRGSVARTLTFMPLVGKADPVRLAMLWPVTAAVPWNGDQFLDDSLSRQFAEGGRLRILAELALSAGDQPLTWVLDPAVVDAAQNMSDGFTAQGRRVSADSAAAGAAAEWLNLLRGTLGDGVALAVPYADPDVAALGHAGLRPGLRKAARAADEVLDRLGVARLGLLWPADGLADADVLATADQFDPELTLLSRSTFAAPPRASVVDLPAPDLGDADAPDRGEQTRPSLVVDRPGSHRGLRPQPGQSTLQWRQLILANTALRSLADGPARHTAIAMPSRGWWPDASWRRARFFEGLQVPWIRLVSATSLASSDHPDYRGDLVYPRSARRHELGERILGKVRRIRRTSRTMNNLLAEPAPNLLRTDKAFGLSSSTAWRDDRRTGRRIARHFLRTNKEMIGKIELEAPNFVTLSSNSGRFPLSITNRLNQPVTVQLDVSARDPGMSVAPIDEVTLQRDQRVTVSVVTSSRGVGITTLTARMLTQEGRPFGQIATFQVRTTQIGVVVWVVIGIGAAVLFVAAGRRIFLRLRAHRRRVRGAR